MTMARQTSLSSVFLISSAFANRPICCIVVEAVDESVCLLPFASPPFNFATQHLFFLFHPFCICVPRASFVFS